MSEDIKPAQIFRPGDQVELEFRNEINEIIRYKSKVRACNSDHLILNMPRDIQIPVRIREGCELTVWKMYDQSKQAFVSNIFVIDNVLEKVPLLVCSAPRVINVASKRRFTRCSADMTARCVINNQKQDGLITDISLSGCHAILNRSLPVREGENIDLSINLRGKGDMSLSGTVIRFSKLARDKKIGVAIEFKQISSGDQDILHNFLFQQQRILIRKGILLNDDEFDLNGSL